VNIIKTGVPIKSTCKLENRCVLPMRGDREDAQRCCRGGIICKAGDDEIEKIGDDEIEMIGDDEIAGPRDNQRGRDFSGGRECPMGRDFPRGVGFPRGVRLPRGRDRPVGGADGLKMAFALALS